MSILDILPQRDETEIGEKVNERRMKDESIDYCRELIYQVDKDNEFH